MVRNQTITSSVSADLGDSFQGTLNGARARVRALPIGLPESIHSFFLLLIGVAVACVGLASYVSISVELFQTKQLIQSLEDQYQAAERQNSELIWAIARHTSLAEVEQRALALGYEVAQTRLYVISPETPPSIYRRDLLSQFDAPTPENVLATPARSPIAAWFEELRQQLMALAD
jgi:hypothetical protein